MRLEELTIGEAGAALRRGEMTAAAYAEALLERCARVASLNAFIAQDAATVRSAARRADEARKAGGPLGPLHGVPLAIKDNVDTADLPTTGGTAGLKANRPKRNAPVAQKLLDAGAILFGKANLHELAFGVTNNNKSFGAARNPYDPSRIPGGSSGGTAAAVAARLVAGGIGSDTGGSVRIPAALCGIVGFRPTTGRWSAAGVVPISPTRDTPGPMTRSVADCVLLDGIVTGGATALAPATLQGMRLGVPRGYFWENLDGNLARLLEDALARLRDAGAVLVEGDVVDVGRLNNAATFPIALYEVVRSLKAYLTSHEVGLDLAGLIAAVKSPDVKDVLEAATGAGAVSEAAYREALKNRAALQESFRRYFREHSVTVALLPTTPLPAAKIGEDETTLLNGAAVPTFPTFIRNTDPGSVAGVPTLSLPAGITKAGLPVGLELDGPEGNDYQVLAVGCAIEAVLPKLPAPPFPK